MQATQVQDLQYVEKSLGVSVSQYPGRAPTDASQFLAGCHSSSNGSRLLYHLATSAEFRRVFLKATVFMEGVLTCAASSRMVTRRRLAKKILKKMTAEGLAQFDVSTSLPVTCSVCSGAGTMRHSPYQLKPSHCWTCKGRGHLEPTVDVRIK